MSTTIRQALQHVANYPSPLDDDVINMPVWELVARELFTIANSPDAHVRGAAARANKARNMILNRMDGKRRTGTKPITREGVSIEFIDLTGGELDAPAQATG